MTTTIGIQVSLKFCYKLLLSKEMYQAFHHELLSSVKNVPAEVGHDIINSYDKFTQNLLEVARRISSQKANVSRILQNIIPKIEISSYWNESCSEAMHNKKMAIRKFISTPTEENYLSFHKARTDCFKKLSK